MRATRPACWRLFATTMAAGLLAGGRARAEEPASGPAARSARSTAPYARASAPAAFAAEGWTDLLGRAAGRYRPHAWHGDEDGPLATFHAGHVPFAPAYAGVRLVTALRSRGKQGSAHGWLSFGLTEGAAVALAALRPGAGVRPLSDVLGSLAIGHASGVGVALAHPTMKKLSLGALLVSPRSVSWSGVF